MARIIPESTFYIKTNGEHAEQVAVDCLSVLPDNYTIIRNVNICSKGGRHQSELDLAVVTPSGFLAVIEVKAGDLEMIEGEIYRDYHGEKKNVLKQFYKQGSLLKGRFRVFNEDLDYRQYFVLPTGILEGNGIGVAVERVYDSRTINELPEAIRQMEVRYSADPNYQIDTDALIDFLLNEYTIKPNVSSISPILDERCEELASGLATWVPRIQSPLSVVEVKAPAGAGKTQLAVKLLEEAVKEGKRAVYINFTLNLADRIRRLSVGSKARFVGTWHELACEATGLTPDHATGADLNAFYEDVSQKLMTDLQNGRYEWDLIVVDDAQALESDWIAALTKALSEYGSLYVLSDPNQNQNRDPIEFSESIVIESHESARVPQRQAEEMEMLGVAPKKFASQSPYVGEHTTIYGPYNNERSLIKQTEKAIADAIKAGFAPEQIAVLSLNARSKSEVLKREAIGQYTLKKPTNALINGEQQFTEGEIYVDTVYRFKGLQAPYVIVTEIDFEQLGKREKAALYMAMTRCSMRLAFVISEKALQAFQ